MYFIAGITEKVLKELEIELGYSVIKEDYISAYGAGLHDIYLHPDCILKINDSSLTIDLGGMLYTVRSKDYVSLTVK